MKLDKLLSAVLLSGVLVSCTVGPKYQRPAIQTPTTYRDPGADTQLQAQAASYADLPWWQVFQDPKLQELVRTALKQNYDLQIATERINAARAQVTVTRSSLFPQVSGNGNFSGGKEHLEQSKYNFLAVHCRRGFPTRFFRTADAAPLKQHGPSSWLLRMRGKSSC